MGSAPSRSRQLFGCALVLVRGGASPCERSGRLPQRRSEDAGRGSPLRGEQSRTRTPSSSTRTRRRSRSAAGGDHSCSTGIWFGLAGRLRQRCSCSRDRGATLSSGCELLRLPPRPDEQVGTSSACASAGLRSRLSPFAPWFWLRGRFAWRPASYVAVVMMLKLNLAAARRSRRSARCSRSSEHPERTSVGARCAQGGLRPGRSARRRLAVVPQRSAESCGGYLGRDRRTTSTTRTRVTTVRWDGFGRASRAPRTSSRRFLLPRGPLAGATRCPRPRRVQP